MVFTFHQTYEITMRKLIATVVVAGTLLVTGCASTSPWDGVPYQERQAWSGIGIEAFDAKSLRKNGFTPEDTKLWVQSGFLLMAPD